MNYELFESSIIRELVNLDSNKIVSKIQLPNLRLCRREIV